MTIHSRHDLSENGVSGHLQRRLTSLRSGPLRFFMFGAPFIFSGRFLVREIFIFTSLLFFCHVVVMSEIHTPAKSNNSNNKMPTLLRAVKALKTTYWRV